MAVLVGLVSGSSFIACGSSNSSHGTGGGDGGDATSSGSSSGAVNIGDAGNPFGSDGGCASLGNKCAANGACCSGVCDKGACGFPACASDGTACTGDSQCCSGTCTGGKCAALNPMCKTLGNTCTTASDCCSGYCSGGTCQPSSFCGQAGDACHSSSDCCTGTCTLPSGGSVGTCGMFAFGGNCSAADGQLCNSPAGEGGCGGSCCSRLCAPWGPTGVEICQPATGCHVEGDTCTADSDCCGAEAYKDAGIPTSGSPVVCMNGYCQTHKGCAPNGDVCKLMTTSCNANQDCCAGLGNKNTACRPDNLGVPRCADEMCQNAGAACATSADCCNGNPCVPNPSGNPPLVCYTGSCVSCSGGCTTNADCCTGTSCLVPTGSTHGTCGPCGTGSSSGSGSGSSSGSTPDAGPTCALYGQQCMTSADCCNGVPCTMGRCIEPIQ
jgi:hypothetical protein